MFGDAFEQTAPHILNQCLGYVAPCKHVSSFNRRQRSKSFWAGPWASETSSSSPQTGVEDLSGHVSRQVPGQVGDVQQPAAGGVQKIAAQVAGQFGASSSSLQAVSGTWPGRSPGSRRLLEARGWRRPEPSRAGRKRPTAGSSSSPRAASSSSLLGSRLTHRPSQGNWLSTWLFCRVASLSALHLIIRFGLRDADEENEAYPFYSKPSMLQQIVVTRCLIPCRARLGAIHVVFIGHPKLWFE